ncbi:MAG: hypothetical protein HY273_05105 [Gammaproteobacteria bacterium]|nr:hypothetical protein [Gammaproteobacteria bacterium]
MFNSTVLEVAIGLVFCYASISLIASSINEAIASALKLRGRTLLAGIKSLLNDPQFSGLAQAIYNHGLINPQTAGRAKNQRELTSKPSYIPSKQFATAFIDVLQTPPGNAQHFVHALNALKDDQLRSMLLGMYQRAAGDLEKLRTELAVWFDYSMERVAGGYKRRSQLICFIIALVLAALFNIDSFRLFETLWIHPALTAQLALAQHHDLSATIDGLKLMPVGWEQAPEFALQSKQTWVMFAGWLVTASSALFGAPFWFDVLQKLTQLRGTGKKPEHTGTA